MKSHEQLHTLYKFTMMLWLSLNWSPVMFLPFMTLFTTERQQKDES